jgi:hypothetical protein
VVSEKLFEVDWRQPWLAPLCAEGDALEAHLHSSLRSPVSEGHVAEALNSLPAAATHPIRFVRGDAAPHGEAYEAFIGRTFQVPTRDNLHDLFNGLVWRQFPRSKMRLNALHAQAIGAVGVGAARGPVRDAMTVFDENGALLLAPPAVAAKLWGALLARDWHGLLWTHRALWAQAQLVLFGHALMEQLVSPRKPITAHVWVQPFDVMAGVELDAALAADLTAQRLQSKPFAPLPVLGVPGWWPANASPGFYDDPWVFRPARSNARIARLS